MLPDRPSSRAAGLPTTPRSTTRSRPGEPVNRYEREQGNIPSSSRKIRTQKSIPSLPRRERSRSPPLAPSIPRSRTALQNSNSRPYDEPEPRVSLRKSGDSSSGSSSTSSILDRIKLGTGYPSSLTSVEDDERTYVSKRRDNNRGQSPKDNRLAREESPSSRELDGNLVPANDVGDGTGYTIWSRVATAASTLTVSVGKAWATNVITAAGEVTPPGQESRLTRAMKAYHIAKARDPSDLPKWLFEVHERQPSVAGRRREADEYEVIEGPSAELLKSRGLRDIYEASASMPLASPPRPNKPAPRSYAGEAAQPSKATNRLKALRDAKRGAVKSYDDDETVIGNIANGSTGRDSRTSGENGQRTPRVGLPSGPVLRSRRA